MPHRVMGHSAVQSSAATQTVTHPNCSSRFLGRNESSVYFVLVTALPAKCWRALARASLACTRRTLAAARRGMQRCMAQYVRMGNDNCGGGLKSTSDA